ncbi:MAG TPA: VCBS repeat-containing protein [Cyclobacteriaceae bacterium]|nr:VCBS repeat-containing protein [Cyclobacteriaceae bacterium]
MRYLRFIGLVWMGLGLYSCAEKEVKKDDASPLFARLSSDSTGITFANNLKEDYDTYFDLFAYVYNGGGVAIGDINNDGLSDIYFTGNEVENKLYLNKGNLKFEDITASAGVQGNGKWNNGVTMVDINGDGFLDIYVCKGGWHDKPEQRTNLLFINDGNLHFTDKAAEYGLDESGYSIHASFFDMDNDNDLDVYITNRPDSFDLPLSEMVRQRKLSPSKSRDKLYVNENNKFREAGPALGITNNFGYALSVVTSDLNNDGYTDIFVANDFAESDYMYINQKNGKFKEQIRDATNHISMYSMGADVADINNDGLEDIMVTEMLPEDYRRSKVSMPSMDVEGFNSLVKAGMHKQYMHNVLHLNQGNLFFSDISQFSGVAKTEWSWSVLMSDFDNDGRRDMFVANGYKRDVFDGDVHHKIGAFAQANMYKYSSSDEFLQKNFKRFIDLYQPIKVNNYVFHNEGDLKFKNVSASWGFTDESFSNGAATSDLDNDGDLDLVINNIDDKAFVYENTTKDASYLKVKLNGPAGNSSGLGAKVTLYSGKDLQFFENKTVRGYLSSNDPVVHFGLGSINTIDSVLVRWPDGKENLVANAKSNQTLTVNWSEAQQRKSVIPKQKMFVEVASAQPVFNHKENELNEYSDQILLPHGFSKAGPFMATGDLNGDGNDDFFIGGAAGQAGAVYIQDKNKFVSKSSAVFEKDKVYEDAGAIFFDADNDKDLDLYVASGGAEFAEGSEKYNDRLYINDGKGNFTSGAVLPTKTSGSCVAAFDADGDGDTDIFRGGQVVVGLYPDIPRSYLMINDNGKLSDKTAEVAPILNEPGLVRSALATDLNGDKKPELIVTGEWMPIRIFEQQNGKLEEVTTNYITDKTNGWWNKVVAEDIDGDGDTDLLAGNIGENYKFKASAEKPFMVYAKDFDLNGTNDVFLARYLNDSLVVPIRGRECTSQQMPVIANRFPTFTAFANSDIRGILGQDIDKALYYEAHLFSSVIFVNDNGKFTIKPLPVPAQLSTVNAFVIRDFNGDGKKDILLGGNKFDTEVETTPADASPGLYLENLGDLKFDAVQSVKSGFFIPFNVKDIQAVNVSGRTVILVSSNNDRLRIYDTASPAPSKATALR